MLLVHTAATHESIPPPPPPKDHNTTPHCSHIDKGKQHVTSTSMAQYSSIHSKIKLVSSGKRILHERHPKIAHLEEKKSQYEDFIKERDVFFRKRFLELF
jgi:hypothetical protein